MNEIVVGIAQFVISSMAFVVVLVGLITTRNHFRVLRSISYIERFNSDFGMRLRSRVEEWLKIESDAEKLERFHRDDQLRAEVLAFMNLFQELGVAYNRRLLDKAVVSELFDFLVPHYWHRLQFLVEHHRQTTGNPYVYRKFKLVNDEMLRFRAVAEKKAAPPPKTSHA